jgi:hypothetical protein
MAVFISALGVKRIELAKELIPSIGGVSYLLNPSNPRSKIESTGALSAARALGIELRVINASSETELDSSFTSVKQQICPFARQAQRRPSRSPTKHRRTSLRWPPMRPHSAAAG